VRTFNRSRKEDEGKGRGTIDVGSQLNWGPGKYEMVLTARVDVDGQRETIYAPAVTVDVIRAYEIEPEVTSIRPGAETELVAQLKREPGFSSPVEVKAENLPLDVECETVTVAPDTTAMRVPCKVGAKVETGEYEIDLASSSVVIGDDGREIPITRPPVKAKLRVVGHDGKLAAR
jgi:hypothetical protein